MVTISLALSFLVRKPASPADQLAVASPNNETAAINLSIDNGTVINTTKTLAQKASHVEKATASVPDKTIVESKDPSVPSLALQVPVPEIKRPGSKAAEVLRENQIAVTQWVKESNFFKPNESLISTVKPKDNISKFMFGASLSPSLSMVNTNDNEALAELMNNEKSLPTYTAGLAVAYKVNSRFSIQTGINLASMGQLVSGIEVYSGLSRFYNSKGSYNYMVETASGTIVADNTDLRLSDASENRVASYIPEGDIDPAKLKLAHVDNDIRQLFRYLEVPVVARYKVIDRKIDMNVSGGLAYGLLVENVAYSVDGNQTIKVGHTEGINKYTFSGQVGVGMEYNVTKIVSLNIEPVFRYYMTPFSDVSGAVTRPFSFGVYSGFFFKF